MFFLNFPDEDPLSQSNISVPTAGRYRVYLRASEECIDTIIGTDTITIFCTKRISQAIEVPFVSAFGQGFSCVQDSGKYNVHLKNHSTYFTDPDSVQHEWWINGSLVSTDMDLDYMAAAGSALHVRLLLYNNDSSYTCEAEDSVFVPVLPVADFTLSQSAFCVGSAIAFFPVLDTNMIIDQLWDFGDGSQSRLLTPSKVYDQAGTFDMILEVTGMYGCTALDTQSLTVTPDTLSGSIQDSAMTCDASAQLYFEQETGRF